MMNAEQSADVSMLQKIDRMEDLRQLSVESVTTQEASREVKTVESKVNNVSKTSHPVNQPEAPSQASAAPSENKGSDRKSVTTADPTD